VGASSFGLQGCIRMLLCSVIAGQTVTQQDSLGMPEKARTFLDSLRNRPAGLLPVSTYVGYGAGQIGGQILRDTPALILPIFMTTVLGLEAALAGLVIIIAKFWVVLADPIAGVISDKTETRWGRRRPLILVGGLISALCFVLLFFTPDTERQLFLFLYMTVIYLILNTGFSMFSVPYLTMASEISDNPDERTTILSFRNAFLAVGLIIGGALSPKIIAYVTQTLGGTPREGYELMALVLGATIALSTIWVFLGTARAPTDATVAAAVPLREQLRVAWANKPFVTLIAANIVQYISAGIGYAGGFFFLAYSVGLGFEVYNIVPIWIILISVASIVAMPGLVWSSARFGKMTVYKVCLLTFSVTTPLYFFASPDTLWIVWLVAILIGIFNGGFILMSFSILTDTINYDRMMSGISREGALSSVYSAVDKVGNAVGAAIFLGFLSMIGFVESDDGSFPTQTDDVLRSILIFYILAPAILHASSVLILNRYRLTKADLGGREADA
jgi:GPH family glycoside/pentoside/hexuronide:cation symporter